ncbi:MAG: bifunctional riboflavin kinase/FAD synthetase [Cyclobacteriaceae bacterium]|nr:bifunctional riboflavin kinase/FAD synthetase [Cyclobacteriaceae bacterium]MCB9236590.1 bifunctional riboflavin kinase/FAD synthetase [Flammeovirgaceae bacterium]MCB0500792.1 bifunctional riboflavin kinase/FAD synthetase [Cyclobacteriaceae bacterium]MCO5273150.1 bifunctional riboflavin kinase/FAD synthetase [Cyclobacteriaceae bacterium]MCW5903255.1 bifunctional riboflavin kinase/FAD synthetase [Cyclobacteriaceae bacterium]
MKIYHSIDDFPKVNNAIVTSGTYDGVHIGHQKILARLKEIAEKFKGETVVITFWPHPRLVLYPEENTLQVLNTFEEKAALLKEQGIQHLLRIPFTKEFSQKSSQEFIDNILVKKIGTKKLVIGYDHRFGKNREGSFEQLKLNGPQYGFDVEEIPRQDVDNVGVSSTKIRKALTEGDIETATHFLGRPYSISGMVVKGEKLGRVLGFPTANVDVDSHYKLIPAEGIYAVMVEHAHKAYGGMLYIGHRPTVGGTQRSIEVNIFDFDKDIYGEDITIKLMAPIRKDAHFDDLEALKKQLIVDKSSALNVLREGKWL